MALIDNQVYKLDNHDIKLGNALYKCFDGERYCKAMIKNLVFYDRNSVLHRYAAAVPQRKPYDLSDLNEITFLSSDENVARIVPLDKGWLGVFVKDSTTNEVKKNKIMYLSLQGDGYVSDDVETALEGTVPKEIYLKHLDEDLASYNSIDEKYFDGTHDDFLAEFFEKARDIITDDFVKLLKSGDSKVEDRELKEDLTLEEIRDLMHAEFRKKSRTEDFEIFNSINMLYYFFNCDKIIELSNRYKSDESQNKIIYQEK